MRQPNYIFSEDYSEKGGENMLFNVCKENHISLTT